MAKVCIVEKLRQVEGSCSYDGISIWSKAQHWYNQDVWLYYFDRLGCDCTAWKEIMEIGGYLPASSWQIVDNIPTPEVDPKHNLVIEEYFEESGRCGNEDVSYSVRFSPTERTVSVDLPVKTSGSEVYVSPHANLIVGAQQINEHLVLSSIHFMNVEERERTPR